MNNNNRSTEIENIDNIKLTIMINIYAFHIMRNIILNYTLKKSDKLTLKNWISKIIINVLYNSHLLIKLMVQSDFDYSLTYYQYP